MKKTIIILLLVSIVILSSLFFDRENVSIGASVNSSKCIEVSYIRDTMYCWYPGYRVSYYAGWDDIMLTGKMPTDDIYDGMSFTLSGHLVEQNSCTMFFVEEAIACSGMSILAKDR